MKKKKSSFALVIFLCVFLAGLFAGPPAHGGTEIPITTDPAIQIFPVISGDTIAWTDLRNGNRDIYIYDLRTGIETQITSDLADQGGGDIYAGPEVAIDRYGNVIVWTDSRNGDKDIYMYEISTGTETRITTDSADQHQPDIWWGVIVWTDHRNANADIYMYEISTGIETQITTETITQYRPAVAGQYIVWQEGNGQNDDIYRYDRVTGGKTPITNDSDYNNRPDVSASGWVVWKKGLRVLDLRDIYMYDILAGTTTQITTNGSVEGYPTIFGNRIVWDELRIDSVNRHIYAYNIARPWETETQVTTDPVDHWYPAVYADRVVWIDSRNGNYDVFMTDIIPDPSISDAVTVTENLLTSTTFPTFEDSPALGNDGSSDIVVYTKRDLQPNGFFDQGDIWYQRLNPDGSPLGQPVQVTSDATRDDRLNDVYGDYIVFKSYDGTGSSSGNIMLYRISTDTLQQIASGHISNPYQFRISIHGNYVVWDQNYEVMFFDLAWLDNGQSAQSLIGNIPSTVNAEIGDRFVVWTEKDYNHINHRLESDIGAYDLVDDVRIRLTETSFIEEGYSSTSGPWIAWHSQDIGGVNSRIEIINLAGDYRIIFDDGISRAWIPSIDGDLVTFSAKVNGNWDVFAYRISTNEIFQVTTDPADQVVWGVFGNKVAYVTSEPITYAEGVAQSGNMDIVVAKLDFVSGPLIARYTFNGNADDSSGNNLHGTIFGGAAFTADRFGTPSGAIELDGIDDYVEFPGETSFDLTEFTILATLKVPDYQQENWLISKGAYFGNYTLRINDSQTDWPGYACYVHQTSTGNWDSLVSSGVVPTSEFFNIAVTLSPTEFKGYINGEPQTTVSNPDPPVFNNEPVRIGAGGYSSLSEFFKGVIDEVWIYNVALSATEIRDLHDTPPVANAGGDQTVHAGTVVTLDGSASIDPDGHYPLSYSWTITSKPAGSSAALSDPGAISPSVTADEWGDYTIELVVTDSLGLASAPDTVTVSTINTAPIADAGLDQAIILLGTTVQLDGTQSYDPDGDTITYVWKIFEKPFGSEAALNDLASPTPTFVADVQGDYRVKLIVSDPWDVSAPDEVTVSFNNVPPVANAGGNQAALVGDAVFLNGAGSSDANSDPLTYSWSFVSKPAGSTAELLGANNSLAIFTADEAGTFVVSLVVNDGFVDGAPDNATIEVITAQNAGTDAIEEAIYVINHEIDPSDLRNRNLAKSFTNKLNAVLKKIERGEYLEALDKLENDILGKTDGCANTGEPDRNDWITDCAAQGQVYPLIIQAIDFLRTLV